MDRLGYLESFLEVLDRGSLSAAARARNVSQPAISQQMAALEADFGTQLLQRTRSGTVATRAGAIIAAKHDQGIVELPGSLQLSHDLADGLINVIDHRSMYRHIADVPFLIWHRLPFAHPPFFRSQRPARLVNDAHLQHPRITLLPHHVPTISITVDVFPN